MSHQNDLAHLCKRWLARETFFHSFSPQVEGGSADARPMSPEERQKLSFLLQRKIAVAEFPWAVFQVLSVPVSPARLSLAHPGKFTLRDSPMVPDFVGGLWNQLSLCSGI